MVNSSLRTEFEPGPKREVVSGGTRFVIPEGVGAARLYVGKTVAGTYFYAQDESGNTYYLKGTGSPPPASQVVASGSTVRPDISPEQRQEIVRQTKQQKDFERPPPQIQKQEEETARKEITAAELRKLGFSEAAIKKFNIRAEGDEFVATVGGKRVLITSRREFIVPESAKVDKNISLRRKSTPKKEIPQAITRTPFGEQRVAVPAGPKSLRLTEGEITAKPRARTETSAQSSFRQRVQASLSRGETATKFLRQELKPFNEDTSKGARTREFLVASPIVYGYGFGTAVREVKERPIQTAIFAGSLLVGGGLAIRGLQAVGLTSRAASFVFGSTVVGAGAVAKEIQRPGSVTNIPGALATTVEFGTFALPFKLASSGIGKLTTRFKTDILARSFKTKIETSKTATVDKTFSSGAIRQGKVFIRFEDEPIEFSYTRAKVKDRPSEVFRVDKGRKGLGRSSYETSKVTVSEGKITRSSLFGKETFKIGTTQVGRKVSGSARGTSGDIIFIKKGRGLKVIELEKLKSVKIQNDEGAVRTVPFKKEVVKLDKAVLTKTQQKGALDVGKVEGESPAFDKRISEIQKTYTGQGTSQRESGVGEITQAFYGKGRARLTQVDMASPEVKTVKIGSNPPIKEFTPANIEFAIQPRYEPNIRKVFVEGGFPISESIAKPTLVTKRTLTFQSVARIQSTVYPTVRPQPLGKKAQIGGLIERAKIQAEKPTIKEGEIDIPLISEETYIKLLPKQRFSGYGTVFPVKGDILLTPKSTAGILPISEIKPIIRGRVELPSKLRIATPTRVESRARVETPTKVRVETPSKTKVETPAKIVTVTKTEAITQTQSLTRTPTTPIKGFSPFTFSPPTSPPPEYPFPSKKKKKDEFFEAFNVFIKRGGKFELLGKNLPFGKGLKLGSTETRRTLSATFKLERAGKTTEKDISFRPSQKIFREFAIRGGKRLETPLKFIQKKGTRLGTPSEVSSIQQYRKLSII